MATELTILPTQNLEAFKGVKKITIEEYFTSGHRTCQGCESALVMKLMAKAAGRSYGAVLYNEVRSALYDLPNRPHVISFICGLGGREVTLDSVTEMSEILLKGAQTGKFEQPNYWIGVRG